MKTVLLFGAGRSTYTLIKYLTNESETLKIKVIICDITINDFVKKQLKANYCEFVKLDICDINSRRKLISESNLVISMLPPSFHIDIAKDCIYYKVNLITASYVSDEMSALDEDAKKANIIILNEVGLDPGIDHISAMDIINKLKDKNAVIKSFKSHCGGLIAPESDNNPWNYKFTWNPRNVILAGSYGAKYLKNNLVTKFNYNEVFSKVEKVKIPGYGVFESYANRDSLPYKSKYGLEDSTTILRGTIRAVGFCKAWDVFVQLGMTSDSGNNLIQRELFNDYVKKTKNEDISKKMNYLDLFEKKYTDNSSNPYKHLYNVLIDKWKLSKNDIDMIVMQHIFDYKINNVNKTLKLSMIVKGDNDLETAMAKTVGLPVFFATRLILKGEVNLKGVKIPIHKQLYEPILHDLMHEGIEFIES